MAIYSGFSHWKWWFSIAMLNYQRVKWGTCAPYTIWPTTRSLCDEKSEILHDIAIGRYDQQTSVCNFGKTGYKPRSLLSLQTWALNRITHKCISYIGLFYVYIYRSLIYNIYIYILCILYRHSSMYDGCINIHVIVDTDISMVHVEILTWDPRER